jgi:ABC-type ATPase involved in cell division
VTASSSYFNGVVQVFITGDAGTGKSYTLREAIRKLKMKHGKVVICSRSAARYFDFFFLSTGAYVSGRESHWRIVVLASNSQNGIEKWC